jgi:hypothetical protein
MALILMVIAAVASDPTVELRGTLRRLDIEGGAWVLQVGTKTYDLHGVPANARDGQKVIVVGRLRPDVACIHMTGPVVQVESVRITR